jgi:hypothetical protein
MRQDRSLEILVSEHSPPIFLIISMSGGRQRRLIRANIPDQLLVDWFTKSLLPPIAKDVSMSGVVTKDQAILHSQHLDLIYSQFGTLYDIIPHAMRLLNDPHKPNLGPHVDGMLVPVLSVSWAIDLNIWAN